ncbi:MAG: polymer-forming cytoskeletal protein [Akkermansiaceae bacterium]
MFKKVIGQESNESQSQPAANEQPAATTSRESSAYGSSSTPPPSSPKPASGGSRNVLSSDVEIKGTVKFQHDLIVDGKIEGDIQSTGNLTIGENARIKAQVKVGTVVVYGKVHGNMVASELVELKSSAEVVGDIKTKTLTIEAGAIFVGKSTVGTPTQGTIPANSNSNSNSKSSQNSPSSSKPAMAK